MTSLDRNVFRIFEVRAKPGQARLLRQKLSETSIAVVKNKPGNLGYFFGHSLCSDEHDLVFISVWQDLAAVKSRFGDAWQESFLPAGYEEIFESCSIRHVEINGELIP